MRHDFNNREELATQLALRLGKILSLAISQREKATLAVSGGSTPKLLFQHLSQQKLDWSRVTVTLVDERLVPADNNRSNEKMVRELLLQNGASSACFVGLTFEAPQALRDVENNLEFANTPFDAVILGMGNDGHTASFFPSGDMLDEAVSPNTDKLLCLIEAPGADEPRITFTLPSLVNAHHTFLHIEGREKLDVLKDALDDGPANDLPIRHILRHKDATLAIYWSP